MCFTIIYWKKWYFHSLINFSGANEEAKVIGVVGGIVELPCDTIPAHSGLETNPTTVLLVVWYKDEVPVYRWDFSF